MESAKPGIEYCAGSTPICSVHWKGRHSTWPSLMPEDKRATLEGLSEVLSEYYNFSGRLATFSGKFESVVCQDEEDPSVFATELEILAIRGFGNVGPNARTRTVRDRFISVQRDCGLRRHLDGVPPDTLIRDIVDRCQI